MGNSNLSSTDHGADATLRLRVFAGPNGSRKSTVIHNVRDYKTNNRAIDFGIYINADDIAQRLRESTFSFSDYEIATTRAQFIQTAKLSGLINGEFDEVAFSNSFIFKDAGIKLKNKNADERLAQIIADFLRKKLLAERKKFSFETVFSHPSKLDIMRQAAGMGYKVYLYFVSTESPQINIFRVKARRAKGGHDVPFDKIESRYYRSMGLLFDACQIAYQTFFWDNSIDGTEAKLFAHFKKTGDKKVWDRINKKDIPYWFRKYYSAKIK